MTIYDEYVEHCNTYVRKYGPDTVVLLEVGQFFEMYASTLPGTDDQLEGADIHRVAELCNLVVTRKNKALPESGRSNPLMAGFPVSAMYKHSQALVNAGWTVVVIRQTTPPPNVKRAVTEILSPSTVVDGNGAGANEGDGGCGCGSFLMVMHWCRCPKTKVPSVGLAGVDVSTGHTFVAEAASSSSDPMHAYNEAYRIMHTYAPKEVVVIGRDADPAVQEVLQRSVLLRWGDCCQEYEKLASQNRIMARAYAKHPLAERSMLSMVELAGLERMDLARTAFAYMLQFAYEHNETIVDRVQLPQVLEASSQLTLEYNSALQLNLTSSTPGERPLLTLLNRCATAFGARLFRERLLSPSCDVQVITERLDRVERFVQDSAVRADVHRQLRGVVDLERMLRRMVVGSFQPLDWGTLHASLERVVAACVCLTEAECMRDVQDIVRSYTSVLDLQECSKYLVADIKGNIFLAGVHPDMDANAEELAAALQQLQAYADALCLCDKSAKDATQVCKLECNDREGYHLTMTKRRWELACKAHAQQKGVLGTPIAAFRTAPVSASSSTLRITCPDIQRLSNQVHALQARMCTMAQARYRDFVQCWLAKHSDAMQSCVAWLAETDVACTAARNAVDFAYVRPDVHVAAATDTGKDTDKDEVCSSVECTSMRHPIIERLHTQLDYVANDIALDGTGMLLYGINASGKSSTMKAVGLNVIMAQAGMFVACSRMRLRPYSHLFTRISGADNIYRGMSSFTVEMTELRNILQRANCQSLVLGDELCCGTEAISALAIVTAGVHHLSAAKASFIFATHLHELTAMPAVKELLLPAAAQVQVRHMHIELDPASGAIVYHRKLREGQGSSVYGLEVCKALGMPDGFVRLADLTRRHIQAVPQDLIQAQGKKKSRYNRQVVMDMCMVCNAAPATETHHIRYQKDADASTGIVDAGLHVHRASNLVPLCEACHLKEHTGQLHIIGYRQTTQGLKLHVQQQPQPQQHPTITTSDQN